MGRKSKLKASRSNPPKVEGDGTLRTSKGYYDPASGTNTYDVEAILAEGVKDHKPCFYAKWKD